MAINKKACNFNHFRRKCISSGTKWLDIIRPKTGFEVFSLRLGHLTALTVRRTVIHYRSDASLPVPARDKGRFAQSQSSTKNKD